MTRIGRCILPYGGVSNPDPSIYCPANGFIDPNDPDYYIQPRNTVSYGLLYSWLAATNSLNICSAGWHLPTKVEFETLVTNLGGYTVAGGKLKETGLTHWTTPNTGATNESGFNGRGAGRRNFDTGTFNSLTTVINIWTSTVEFASTAFILQLTNTSQNTSIFSINKNFAASIRPVKDSTTLSHGETGFYVDPSGFVYRTICINGVEYVADNIKTQHYRNGDAIPEVTDNTAWAALTTGALCAYENNWSNV